MARLIYAERALVDLERLTDFLVDSDPAAAEQTTDLIIHALEMLAVHPLIGRPRGEHLRELMISRGETGYAALYSVEDPQQAVLILTIRHQREAGHLDDAMQNDDLPG